MQNQTSFPYLIKRDFDVFHSGHILPLIEGNGYLAPKNKTKIKKSIPAFTLVRHKKSLKSTPLTRCSNTDYPLRKHLTRYSSKRANCSEIPTFNFNQNETDGLQLFHQRKQDMRNIYINNITKNLTGMPHNHHRSEQKVSKSRHSSYPKKKEEAKPQATKNRRKIFTDEQAIRNMIPPSEFVNLKRKNEIDLRNPHLFSNLDIFHNLSFLLAKFLMNSPIECQEIAYLSNLEQDLFLLYVNKKKKSESKIKKLNKINLSNLNKNWIKKRTNKNLRYVVNKVLKLLRESFKAQLFDKMKRFLDPKYLHLNDKAKFDYCFYGYYFLDAVTYIDKEIETYFHPNSRRNNNLKGNKLIPTHISETYLNNLRTSKLFVRDFIIFLKKYLISEAKQNIVSSLKKTCREWENWYKENGEKVLMKKVLIKFKENPKGKFPWGIQEVEEGIQNILFKLGQV